MKTYALEENASRLLLAWIKAGGSSKVNPVLDPENLDQKPIFQIQNRTSQILNRTSYFRNKLKCRLIVFYKNVTVDLCDPREPEILSDYVILRIKFKLI